jgi:hypothetical protein
MPPRKRHWGGNKGSHWGRKKIAGIIGETYDMPTADELRPTLDITVVPDPPTRRYQLAPLEFERRPNARNRLWGKS